MGGLFVTVDIDWAPDWAIRRLLEQLLHAGVRSTWFVTHPTQVLDEMRRYPGLVDLGIHPNFLAGSSHGSTTSEVLASCMGMVPEARTMRTHGLAQSTAILQTVVAETPIELDASLYLRGATAQSVSELPLAGRSLARIPYVWEDDLEFFARDPQWDGESFLRGRSSRTDTTIVDLHPIHVALNSGSIEGYRTLKESQADLRSVHEAQAMPLVSEGPGAASFLASLLKAAVADGWVTNVPLVDLARG